MVISRSRASVNVAVLTTKRDAGSSHGTSFRMFFHCLSRINKLIIFPQRFVYAFSRYACVYRKKRVGVLWCWQCEKTSILMLLPHIA